MTGTGSTRIARAAATTTGSGQLVRVVIGAPIDAHVGGGRRCHGIMLATTIIATRSIIDTCAVIVQSGRCDELARWRVVARMVVEMVIGR